MINDFVIAQLRKTFKGRQFFSREELRDFYMQFETDLKDVTFRGKIHDLKNKQIIMSISKTLLTLAYKPAYKPNIDTQERKIFAKLSKQFPTLQSCIWNTQIVSEFMLHIPAKLIIILQVEKEALEPVYDFMKTQKQSIFIQPEEKEIERYVYESESAIVLQSLVTKSPIQKVNRVATVTLEKLIVDLFSDKKLFAVFQGNELIHIVNTAYNRYAIDFTKLFYYAKRRRKEVELKELLLKTDIPQNIFAND
jgi:hypothetical protein